MKKVEENIIIVGDTSLHYDEFVASLADLSIKNITDILLESQITIPRKLNVTALRLALNEKIVIAKTLNLSDEELFRLRFYPFFNEFQLQKLFTTLYEDELFTKYRKSLIELIIQNNEYLRIEDNLVNKLLNVPNKFEDFSTYQEILNKSSFDFDGYFDGVKFDDYDDNILKSLTSDDIRLLGAKYDVVIPKRLKKEELISYVKEVMDLNGKSIPENVNLDSQSIMMVQRFAKKNNIKISADLKKDECLNYLFHQVGKKDIDYKKEVLLNLYLGDSFVFDLSYVLKTEEKAPLPEVKMEEEVNNDTPKVEELPVLEGQIEVIDETPLEPTLEEKEEPKEEKEEVKEEVCQKSVEKTVVVEAQPIIDPKELVNIITKSVKEIVVDVVKEIAPLFKEEPKEIEVKTEEELIEQKVYNYDNFSNQKNPNYDEEIHHFIRDYDCKQINPTFEEIKVENEQFAITDLASENIAPEVVSEQEEEIDLENLTEEEKVALKKQKKEQKRQAKIDAKNLKKEEKIKRKEMSKEEKALMAEEKKKQKEAVKLEKKAKKEEEKAQAKQTKLEEKARLKEEKEQEKANKKLEAEQAKIQAKEEKKENKLKLKEEKRVQKETDKKNKAQAKIDAKAKLKQDKIDAKEKQKAIKQAEKDRQIKEEKNYNEIQKVLSGKGDITKIDDDYFNKFMQLQNYKMNLSAYQDRENMKRSDRNMTWFKIIFWLITLAGLTYVGFGMYLSYFHYVEAHPIYTAVMNNPFLKMMFEPFVNWFTQLVPQFKPQI